ncbi:DJ-1/PfpI family protein [Caballeronia sp. J97]|uniref:DJ-1/PfpI family protein n=1 Tax=Caballeronia sp. J97 TaxID=2805429 RepID=UPI002AB00332|nr:DJ-1/PfpI family protein [Caballeronia sp. J97]
MHIAILTFEGFNELDSLIALGILNRVKRPGWKVSIACPSSEVRSMNGVVLKAQATLEDAANADAVIVGSGMLTREVVADASLMARITLDPARQLLAAQCSGTLVLAKLGLLQDVPACTDLTTKPWVEEAGVRTLDRPFVAHGNVATAGGCLASQYLAAWVIARLEGVDAARHAMHYVAPVGEKEIYVERAMNNVTPFLDVAAVG